MLLFELSWVWLLQLHKQGAFVNSYKKLRTYPTLSLSAFEYASVLMLVSSMIDLGVFSKKSEDDTESM